MNDVGTVQVFALWNPVFGNVFPSWKELLLFIGASKVLGVIGIWGYFGPFLDTLANIGACGDAAVPSFGAVRPCWPGAGGSSPSESPVHRTPALRPGSAERCGHWRQWPRFYTIGSLAGAISRRGMAGPLTLTEAPPRIPGESGAARAAPGREAGGPGLGISHTHWAC